MGNDRPTFRCGGSLFNTGGQRLNEIELDATPHLYLRSEMANPRLFMLLPWCLTGVRFPLEHDRPSISRRRIIPKPGRACPVCAAQNERRRIEAPHARS